MANNKKAPPALADMKDAVESAKEALPRDLFDDLVGIIENRKRQITVQASGNIVLMYFELGERINVELLKNERAEYGKKIVASVTQQLLERYGSIFDYTNIRRMMQFAKQFDAQIVASAMQQLTWTHIIQILPLKDDNAKLYYLDEASKNALTVRELNYLISHKAYERRDVSNLERPENSAVPRNLFKDPYLLETLGLKDNFLEADLEQAIKDELEKFILEFGKGFSFVGRQKRMTIDGIDYRLDLLFFNRELKRLVAVELKVGRFKPSHMGQMRLYLKWLDRFERKDGEEEPIGIILCAEADRGTIELMDMEKEGIAVAEYWTKLPPKEQFEHKIQEITAEARERLERRKFLGKDGNRKQIQYFIESNDDED
jgi:predicted nuclease of restriction endonuclease-like (RecB) superfamily